MGFTRFQYLFSNNLFIIIDFSHILLSPSPKPQRFPPDSRKRCGAEMHDNVVPQGSRWYMTKSGSERRKGDNSTGSSLWSRRRTLCQRCHDTEDMVKQFMVAYHTEGLDAVCKGKRFMSMNGPTNRTREDATPVGVTIGFVSKVGIGVRRTLQTFGNADREPVYHCSNKLLHKMGGSKGTPG